MPQLRRSGRTLNALVAATARHLVIEPAFLEKDFWVTEVLRAATAPAIALDKAGVEHPIRTIFKGGTSLSRVYGLIERFSEDVDLLIAFPEDGSGFSNKSRDRVLTGIRDRVADHLGLSGDDVAAGAATTGVKRNVSYLYRRVQRPRAGAVIKEGVLLEMGSRGGSFPTHTFPLRSMIANYAIEERGESPDAWDEFTPVTVEALGAERTLLEKMSLLHDSATRFPDERAANALAKAGRHLYDVHKLLNDEAIRTKLHAMGPQQVVELWNDIDAHSEAAGFSYTPRPPDGFEQSPLLTMDHDCRKVLAAGYTTALGLVYGARPSFDECLATIRTHAHVL